MKRFLGIFFCLVAFFGFNSRLFAATAMDGYCQSPPFLTTPVQPNVMLTIDVSGSMGWCAYNPNSSKSNCCTTNTGCGWTYQGTEEGYFTPDKKYKYDAANTYWVETTDADALTTCPQDTDGISTTATKRYMGSCLNYHLMRRTDLVRWAMTGGNPASCSGTKTFDKNNCDPELWQEPGNAGKVGSVCNDTIGGCILLTDGGTKVKVPWSRVYDGLAFQFKQMSLLPRLGAMFFSDSGIRSDGKVYIGDFTAPNTTSTAFPYINLITAINSSAPDGGTPTGPAMWDTFNYFKQTAPQYGGLAVQSGSGDRWKDPMYVCDGGGANCILTSCAKNFTILMSDGSWNSPSCSIDTTGSDPVMPAYQMHTGFTNAATNVATNVNAVYAIGLFLGGTGEASLKNVAMYGAFNTSGRTWPGSLTGYPQDTCNMNDCGAGKGSGCTPLPTSSSDWDANGNNIPDTFYNASDAAGIKQTIMNAILDILKKASSGTAVSVLSSSEGSGANLMQALFYPQRSFSNNTEVAWTSDLMNYWYYMDPFFHSSEMREDTIREGATATPPYTLLDLQQDDVVSFEYDSIQNKTMAHRQTGVSVLTDLPSVPIEDTIPIWRAGFNLWWTAPDDRTIKTSVAGANLISFNTENNATLAAYLGQAAGTASDTTINYVRGYDCVNAAGTAFGECGTTYPNKIGRDRTVTNGVCSSRRSPCNDLINSTDCPSGETCANETHVWKLGDIISSTPRIMGPAYLNNFNLPSPFGYNDQTYDNFVTSNDYKNRQLVFVGSNDGMLHAFKLGKLLQNWTGKHWYEAAKQEGTIGTGGIGTESYAFIPKNVLPYLQYMHDENYCHIYMVDGPIAITEASINQPSTCTLADYWNCPKLTTMQAAPNSGDVDFAKTSWRTVLIGSMGIGGATCNGAAPDADRISTPISVSGTPVGWSSYFALDVTDQATPQLLWEFSNADLGVTNIGPAIVKVGGNEKRCAISNNVCTTDTDCGDIATNGNCVNTNGRWFAILASGSTGPITTKEFKGTSDKSLKLFVLDLKTGTLLRTIDTGAAPTNLGITNAFAGSISSSVIDLERDRPSESGNYQDDAVYIGYVKDTTNGGVLRLVINDDINPDNWKVSKVIENIGPVTTSVVNLLDRKNGKLWLYFAEGRFFYKTDDPTTQRKLFGIQEPCFQGNWCKINHATCSTNTDCGDTAVNGTCVPVAYCGISGAVCSTDSDCGDTAINGKCIMPGLSPNCTDTLTLANLKDQTTTPSLTLTTAQKGWYINMDAAVTSMSAERVISNPTPDPLGAIYFLSFAPNSDICSFGGTTYLWALDYKTGGTVTFVMQGKALVQVSTGEIKELNLSDALTENEGRKSVGFKGIPPTGQGIMVVTNPLPIKKFLHVQEQ